MKLSVVIPAHNEEDSIETTVLSIHKVLKDEGIEHELLVVNDNSHDETEIILKKLSTNNSSIRYINNIPPNGFGFAVRAGLESFTGDAVAIMMADNSDSPHDLVKFYRRMNEGNYDCVFGSRFRRGGKVIEYPKHKLWLNRVVNNGIRILFGFRYNDTTNAFKLYRAHVVPHLKPFLSHHFNLTVELPLKAIIRGFSYSIVPNSWTNRTAGVSK